MYLLIENPGIVGTDLLTVVGASTARSNDEMIGQFGSGVKFSLALLLRNSLDTKLYIGKNGYEFGVDERETQDVAGRDFSIKEVTMKQVAGSGRKTRNMGFDVSFGECDWKDVGMAVREFISNAADACKTLDGNYSRCRVELVDDNQVRAKDGHTRVFIQANQTIREYHRKLRTHFLIFDENFSSEESIIPKREVNSNVKVYRKGVLVGEFDHKSIFDYNLNDIELKESRIISWSTATYHCASALAHANQDTLKVWLEAVRDQTQTFETTEISFSELKYYSWENKSKLKNWEEAIGRTFGEKAVACDSRQADSVQRKGYKPIVCDPEIIRVLASFNMKVAVDVLDHFDTGEKTRLELTSEQFNKMASIWSTLEGLGVTKGRGMPVLEGFASLMDAGSQTLGYYDSKRDVVGMSSDVLSDEGFTFVKVAIEEFAHSITKAHDETRDLQDWAFKVAAILMSQLR